VVLVRVARAFLRNHGGYTELSYQWSLNAEEVKIPVSKENSQAWNAFGGSTGDMPDNLFAFNTMPQVPSHQFTTPSVPYVGSGTPQDFARSEPERSTPGDMFPGFNVSPGVLGEVASAISDRYATIWFQGKIISST